MSRAARLRPLVTVLALTLLLGALPARCFALILIKEVSTEEAKQLCITVRSQPAQYNDLWIHVEFKTTGGLKGFRWADLELSQGGKRLVTATLMPRDLSPDTKEVEFYLDPTALPNATVMIVAYNEPLTGTGWMNCGASAESLNA